MAWGTPVTESQAAIGEAGKEFANQFSLEPTESAHVQVKAFNQVGNTNDLVVSIYSTVDDATWDDTPITQIAISDDQSGNAVSMIVSGVVKFKIGVASSGATDTYNADLVAAIGTP